MRGGQLIRRRPKGAPLKRWMRNRLKRNKAQACRCGAFPWAHRKGSGGTVRIGRASIEVRCNNG